MPEIPDDVRDYMIANPQWIKFMRRMKEVYGTPKHDFCPYCGKDLGGPIPTVGSICCSVCFKRWGYLYSGSLPLPKAEIVEKG